MYAALEANGDFMRAGFKSLGFDTGHSITPIIPIIIGDNDRTFKMWRDLFDAGVFVNRHCPATARYCCAQLHGSPPPRSWARAETFAKVGRANGLI